MNGRSIDGGNLLKLEIAAGIIIQNGPEINGIGGIHRGALHLDNENRIAHRKAGYSIDDDRIGAIAWNGRNLGIGINNT
jgi:hypothetical protein